ncbi:MAG: hypothetical protein ACK5IB_11725 [Qingshengfaniella sp.]
MMPKPETDKQPKPRAKGPRRKGPPAEFLVSRRQVIEERLVDGPDETLGHDHDD